jgi:diguanylate cyclase (GGDEF)-like protein/PAS domain S-box-containing protein
MKTPLRILIVEDDASDAELMIYQLRQAGYELSPLQVDSAARMAEALQQADWEIVLSDFSLPGFNAAAALKMLQATGRDLPFVVVSGTIGDETALELLRSGAHDYVLKDNLARLPSVVNRELADARVRQEQRQAQAALVASEERFRALADNGRALIWTADAEQRCDYFNQPWLDFTGRSLAEECGNGWRDGIHADDRERCLTTYRNAFAKREKFSTVYRLRRQDGVYRHILDEGTPRFDHTGNFIGYIGHGLDITELKQAEEKAQLAARVFESSLEAIVMTDDQARIVAVNPAFERISGYCEAEVLGQTPSLLQSDRHDAAFFQAMWQRLRSDGQWHGEIYNRRKNKQIYPAWTNINAICDEHGNTTGYISIASDLSDIREAREQLNFFANHDPLTRLPNRTLLNDRLQQAIDAAGHDGRQAAHPFALVLLNIDRLQRVNDGFGHETGDALLQALAARLQGRLLPGDTLARPGSDEFVLLLTQYVSSEDVMAIAHRLLDEVAQPCHVLGQEVTVTASIGISQFPDDGKTPSELLKAADTALSHIKDEGRNGFRFYTASMNTHVLRWMSLEKHLRHAIARNELLLHYQPQVSLDDGHICGMEALIRWNNPELGAIPPSDFIYLAEDTGLIVSIGEWVLRSACAQNKAWQQAGLPPLRVSVNISAHQLTAGSLTATVRQALADSGLEARYLELELTESVLMQETEQIQQQFAELLAMGVALSLDDFGTGYSSLSYLSRMTLTTLKIDRCFITDITTEPKSAAIAHAIITLARGLNITVIAEGVETEGQLNYLRKAGCNAMQGYLFSQALPAAEMAAQLAQNRALTLDGAALESSRTLLLLDDEPNILSALMRLLRRDGYRILLANSANEAFELLANNPVQVVVSDQRMPDMNGTEFLGRVSELHPDTVRMVLSGYSDLQAVTDAVNRGAIYKFLSKPWDDDSLRETIRDAFRRFERERQRRENATG